jgi:hypothetical protein
MNKKTNKKKSLIAWIKHFNFIYKKKMYEYNDILIKHANFSDLPCVEVIWMYR